MILGVWLAGTQANAAEQNRIFVSILPQVFFVERIGGGHVDVDVLVGPGMSPATYDPTPQQMARLAKADLFFRIGVPFEERLIEKLGRSFHDLKMIDTRKGIRLRKMQSHHHGPGGHTQWEGDDPHFWLDPMLAKNQARTICDALIALDFVHEDVFRGNLATLEADLDRIHNQIINMLEPHRGRSFLAFHPAYGYFAEAYGLHQVALETEGKSPSPKQITDWIRRARKEGVNVVFVQPQFADSSARTLAQAIGGEVVSLDPLARDYLKNLTSMAQAVLRAWQTK